KMGFAVARAALRRGADVTLISGPSSQCPPQGADFMPVETADGMRNAVLKRFPNAAAVIMTSAVADFAPAVSVKSKIRKTDAMTLNLKKTPDILKELGRKKGRRILIGFAAEAGRNVMSAKDKLKNKNLDLIVLNDVTAQGSGFDADTNIVTIISKKGEVKDYPLMQKDEVADNILDRLLQLQPQRRRL
ncbi:MAG: bifunctional 4'-phosphopantothenoylcysteine decarboxylase/phosphopantothenoylcysteine synthetase, partial [Nitrospirae bacterium]|nr:bifunctional 4'-phosphopantothenoylcysteine decarboxylase/phosphopantothenoylcysteine synthetase [Nitrospirota bacterium]